MFAFAGNFFQEMNFVRFEHVVFVRVNQAIQARSTAAQCDIHDKDCHARKASPSPDERLRESIPIFQSCRIWKASRATSGTSSCCGEMIRRPLSSIVMQIQELSPGCADFKQFHFEAGQQASNLRRAWPALLSSHRPMARHQVFLCSSRLTNFFRSANSTFCQPSCSGCGRFPTRIADHDVFLALRQS